MTALIPKYQCAWNNGRCPSAVMWANAYCHSLGFHYYDLCCEAHRIEGEPMKSKETLYDRYEPICYYSQGSEEHIMLDAIIAGLHQIIENLSNDPSLPCNQ